MEPNLGAPLQVKESIHLCEMRGAFVFVKHYLVIDGLTVKDMWCLSQHGVILSLSKGCCASSPLFRLLRRMSAECLAPSLWFAFRWHPLVQRCRLGLKALGTEQFLLTNSKNCCPLARFGVDKFAIMELAVWPRRLSVGSTLATGSGYRTIFSTYLRPVHISEDRTSDHSRTRHHKNIRSTWSSPKVPGAGSKLFAQFIATFKRQHSMTRYFDILDVDAVTEIGLPGATQI